jgi:hypothetical protein
MTDGQLKEFLPSVLKLRLLVGFLGEKAQFGWWPTAFFEAYSLRSLEFVAPRTAPLAQYHGVMEAARRAHDERLNVGSYHLFRLPEEVEQDLHAFMQTSEGAELYATVPQDKNAAMAELKRLGAGETPTGAGPAAVGKIAQLHSAQTIKAMAASYYFAFESGQPSYPYLLAKS